MPGEDPQTMKIDFLHVELRGSLSLTLISENEFEK